MSRKESIKKNREFFSSSVWLQLRQDRIDAKLEKDNIEFLRKLGHNKVSNPDGLNSKQRRALKRKEQGYVKRASGQTFWLTEEIIKDYAEHRE